MFLLGALGSIVAWFLRRELPESPRWLVIMGRDTEADALVSSFEREAGFDSASNLPPSPEIVVPHAAGDLFRPPLLASLIVGCVSLMAANTLIYGFVTWLPTFFVGQGDSIARSTGFALLMALGGPIGSAVGALAADYLGRKLTIVVASCLTIVLSVAFVFFGTSLVMPIIGFLLSIPIYISWRSFSPYTFRNCFRQRCASGASASATLLAVARASSCRYSSGRCSRSSGFRACLLR
jgi:putative MFS transporter